MKRIVILITMAAVTLLAACQKKETEREKMDSRPTVELEVSYAEDGVTTETLSFTHEYGLHTLEVTMNVDDLRWNLESDRSWCKVVPAQHKGSGLVTLELEANESFDDRQTATLTFTAGAFRGFTITVDQSGSAFVVSQPYFVAGLSGGDYLVDVTTLAATVWEPSGDQPWISVSEVSTSAPEDGKVTKKLKISAAANTEASRLGSVTLSAGAEKETLRLWQFGTELSWQDGSIFFPKETPASISLVAPKSQVRALDIPDYATQSSQPVDEVLEQYTVTLSDNLSDCAAIRDVAVSLILANNTSTVVPLPGIKQDYTPAGGLMTKEGLAKFAEKVAAGEPTTDWEKDGWVTVLQDIVMTGVSAWQGIGTAEHPFSGKFDGGGFAITKLSASPNGLFNVVAGESETAPAIIKEINLKESSIYRNADWTGEACLGAIVNQAVNAQITDCSVEDCSYSVMGTGTTAYIGGILGKGGSGVSLRKCRVSDKGQILSSCSADDLSLGGVAGLCPTVRTCDMDGTITVEGTVGTLRLGGVTSKIGTGSTVQGNSSTAAITLNGNTSKNYIGSLYGMADNGSSFTFAKADDDSSVGGKITVAKYKADATSVIFVGGFVGYAGAGASLSFTDYEVRTKFLFNHRENRAAAYCCAGGALGGTDPEKVSGAISFTNIVYPGEMYFQFINNTGVTSGVVRGCYGGVAGAIYGPATFSGCVNNGRIGQPADEDGKAITADGASGGPAFVVKKSNNNSRIAMGGIVGWLDGGNATITNCENNKAISNLFYNNNIPPVVATHSAYLTNGFNQFAGGILGAFNYHPEAGSISLTLSGCRNTQQISGFRGMFGGIAGFCQGASVSSCTNVSSRSTASNNAFIQGGIVGCAVKTTVDGCTAKTDLASGVGGNADNSYAGGIVARAIAGDPVTVTNCYYYGTVTSSTSGTKQAYPGGILSGGLAGSSVSECHYGGSIGGVTVIESNLSDLAIGNKTGNVEHMYLWNGTN